MPADYLHELWRKSCEEEKVEDEVVPVHAMKANGSHKLGASPSRK